MPPSCMDIWTSPEMRSMAEGLGPWKAGWKETITYPRRRKRVWSLPRCAIKGHQAGFRTWLWLLISSLEESMSDAFNVLTCKASFEAIGNPAAVICLDAGPENGMISGAALHCSLGERLKVDIVKQVHSGRGIVAKRFITSPIACTGLTMMETGKLIDLDFFVDIPVPKFEDCCGSADRRIKDLPFAKRTSPVSSDTSGNP